MYIELVAKWGESMDGQKGTFDADIVEQLHGIVSRGRLGRPLLTILNLENICLSKKNKLLQFGMYLKKSYPKLYGIINFFIFSKYKISQHIKQENRKRQCIDKGVLRYHRDKIGLISDPPPPTSKPRPSASNKSNKSNLNINRNTTRPPQTAAARAIQREENKRRRRQQQEQAAVRKAIRRRKAKKKQQKKKKVKINDLLDMAGINNITHQYGLYVRNVLMQHNNNGCRSQHEQPDNDEDTDDDELIDECLDRLSDSDNDSE